MGPPVEAAGYRPLRRQAVPTGRLGTAGMLLLAVALGACTTTIVPPREVAEPTRVAVLDHGRHASLVLELPGPRLVRYSYGDWRWYALRDTGAAQGLAALAGSTRAALGRRALPGPLSPENLQQVLRVGVEEMLVLAVETRDAARLAAELDALFEANRATLVYNPVYDLEFVHHPEPYSFGHNSNHMVARWLEALGCRIEGPATFSAWRSAPR